MFLWCHPWACFCGVIHGHVSVVSSMGMFLWYHDAFLVLFGVPCIFVVLALLKDLKSFSCFARHFTRRTVLRHAPEGPGKHLIGRKRTLGRDSHCV
jgi:hypothetical protein